MTSAHSLATVFLQSTLDAGTARDIHWIMISQVVIAVILVAMLLGALIAMLVILNKVKALVDEARQTCNPIIAKGTDLFDNVAPKIRSISENVEQISTTARIKVDELGATISQINRTVGEVNQTVASINLKARVQADRVHGIVTEALTVTEEVSRKVQHGVMVPVRQAAGVVAGFKAALETLAARSGFRSAAKPTSPPVRPRTPSPYDL